MRSTIRILAVALVGALCVAASGCATSSPGAAPTLAHNAPQGAGLAGAGMGIGIGSGSGNGSESKASIGSSGTGGSNSAGSGLTWSRKVQAGVTIAEIEDAFASVAAEDNIRAVGELPLSTELELRSNKREKFLKVYSYCDPLAARTMVDFNPAMAALLPCRIAVVEQADGLWIYTMNMDMLITMQGALPPELDATVRRVRATIAKMLERGAHGEF